MYLFLYRFVFTYDFHSFMSMDSIYLYLWISICAYHWLRFMHVHPFFCSHSHRFVCMHIHSCYSFRFIDFHPCIHIHRRWSIHLQTFSIHSYSLIAIYLYPSIYSVDSCEGSLWTAAFILKRLDKTSVLQSILSFRNAVEYSLMLADILAQSPVEMCNGESSRPLFWIILLSMRLRRLSCF